MPNEQTGKPELIKEIIEGFSDKPYSVIAPVQAHIKDLDVKVPPSFCVRYLQNKVKMKRTDVHHRRPCANSGP